MAQHRSIRGHLAGVPERATLDSDLNLIRALARVARERAALPTQAWLRHIDAKRVEAMFAGEAVGGQHG